MKSYSGKFVLRLAADLHQRLDEIARRQKTSLNQICVSILKKGLTVADDNTLPFLNEVVLRLEKHFAGQLVGVALFGSYATGEATENSDIDLLIVLDDSINITRSLYKWWDDEVSWNDERIVNPHFVSHPQNPANATSLWFEVALTGKILYQKNGKLDKLLTELRNIISEGKVRRYTSNGHPYWVFNEGGAG